MKKCFKCLATKLLDDFYSHPKMKDGHLGKCKECCKDEALINRSRNPDYLERDRRRRATPEYKKTERSSKERRRKMLRDTPEAKRYKNETAEYAVWSGIKNRCLNPKSSVYRLYGGRGITVCEKWKNSFSAFLSDVGSKPKGMTLDRIDNDGNYEPGNVRWATPLQQSHNSRIIKIRAEHVAIAKQMRAEGCTLQKIADTLGFSNPSIYRVLDREKRGGLAPE